MDNKPQYIYLPTNFDSWRWFNSPKVSMTYIWLLFNANLKKAYYRTDTIGRGSVVTTNETIAESCGLTIQNVRTALANLEKTGEITRVIRNRYQIITIKDFDKYVSE